MIDASSFATLHNAFWSEHAPTSEHFVRRLNLEYSERWAPPIEKPVEPIRAAFVAEFAFSVFCGKINGQADDELEKTALRETLKRLVPLMDSYKDIAEPLSEVEKNQVKKLEGSLESFFNIRSGNVISRPIFSG
jgi:hypothetical protein